MTQRPLQHKWGCLKDEDCPPAHVCCHQLCTRHCGTNSQGEGAASRPKGSTAARALVPTAVSPSSGTAATPLHACREGRILPGPCRAVPQLRLQSLVPARWRVPSRGKVLPPWLRLRLPAPIPRCQIRAGVSPSSRNCDTGWGTPAVAACAPSSAASCPQRNQASARWLRRLRWPRAAPPAPRTGSARGLRSAAAAADVAPCAQPPNQVRRWSLEQ